MNSRCILTVTSLLLVALLPSAVAAQEDGGAVIELTLEQAMEMALENNLDIVVSRLGTQSSVEGVNSARGRYRPLLNASFNNLDSQSPATNQLIGADTLTQTTTNYNFSLQQVLSFGLNYAVAFDNRRASSNSAFNSFNPLYDSTLRAQITQPLMNGFRQNPNSRQVLVAQNNERLSRAQFEVQIMDSIRDVQNAYWDLVASIQALEVAQQSLKLATDLLRNNRIQVEVGTMAPIDVLEAEAEVASREESVIVAEEAIRTSEDMLKSLINDPQKEDYWSDTLKPVDEPTLSEVSIDLEESIRVALQRRPELRQNRVELETRTHNVQFTKNQILPSVDLVGTLAYSGLGGDQILRQGFAGEELAVIPGGYGDALDQIFGGDFRDWSVGLTVSYPLGNSTADAQYARAQVDVRQQRAQLDNTEILIAQDVRRTARAVDTNRKRVDATRVARELAQRRFEAEQKKFEVGMSTSFMIVQAQRDLTQAAANELRAIIDYNKAIVAFERARGTLLDRSNVTIR